MIRDAIDLLTGRLNDSEYFRRLEADSFGYYFEVPQRGWSHRAGKLLSAIVQAGALLVSVVLFVAIMAASSIR